MNFQLVHSELKGCYFQVCESQSERLPSVYDRVQNCRAAMSPPPLLRQNDELNHPSVDGSPSHTSEIATSFWNAAAHMDSYIWGIYTLMCLWSIYKPSCIQEPPSFDWHFPKLCQQSLSEHVMILHNPGHFTKKSLRCCLYCHKNNKWTSILYSRIVCEFKWNIRSSCTLMFGYL